MRWPGARRSRSSPSAASPSATTASRACWCARASRRLMPRTSLASRALARARAPRHRVAVLAWQPLMRTLSSFALQEAGVGNAGAAAIAEQLAAAGGLRHLDLQGNHI
eukprot:1893312-Prymnesium_polylepis.1